VTSRFFGSIAYVALLMRCATDACRADSDCPDGTCRNGVCQAPILATDIPDIPDIPDTPDIAMDVPEAVDLADGQGLVQPPLEETGAEAEVTRPPADCRESASTPLLRELVRDGVAVADGYAIGGVARTPTGGPAQGWLRAVDANGAVLFDLVAGGEGEDTLRGVAANDSSVAGVGNAEVSPGVYQGWLWVVGLDGQVRLNQHYGLPGEDWLAAIATLPDGGWLAVGSRPSQGRDAWLLTVDSDGNPIRNDSHGGRLSEEFSDVATGPNGFVAVGSRVDPNNSATRMPLLAFFDSSGAFQTEKFFGDSSFEQRGLAITPTPAGFAIITETVAIPGVLWVDTTGNELRWEQFQRPNPSALNQLTSLPDGDLVLFGEMLIGETQNDPWLLRVSPAGDVNLERRWEYPTHDYGRALIQLGDQLIVAGDLAAPETDLWTQRLTLDGSDPDCGR
jgi:hypothetical protein